MSANQSTAKNGFPKNCWYVGCTPDEIVEKPLGRIVCGENIVFYRGHGGKVAALENFCPHRGLPLSLGFVRDGDLVCGYHGLVMNCDGNCVTMPSQGESVQRLKGVHSYPVEERHGYIWVWTGDPALANVDLIPNLTWASDPEWTFGGNYFHIKCDYRLLVDNLMDLTHETYVHSTSIGQPEIDEANPDVSVEDNEVVVTRHMQNIMPPPFWCDALKGNHIAHDIACDRWQICHFIAPCQVMIEVGVAHAGKGANLASGEHRVSGIVVDLITPETETSCHYFWGLARNFNVADSALTESILTSQGKIFSEDLEVLEQQQLNLLNNPGRRLVTLNTDGGGAHARKMIDKMIARELQGGEAA